MVRSKKGEQADRQQAVIFDFDGTIADTVVAFAEVFVELTKQPEELTAERIQRLKGMSGSEFIKEFRIPKWKVPYLIFRGKRMLKDHMGGIEMYVGMRQLIEALYHKGVPLYIVSSNDAETIQKYLEQQGLMQYFIAVSGGASPFAKARKMLQLIDANNIDTASSWYVGDETRDIIAAHAVGIHVVAVSWGFNTSAALEAKKPDAIAGTATELGTILKDAWKK